MLNLIVSVFLSLLPKAWRGSWSTAWDVDLARGALFSGILECVACGILFGFRYLRFLDARVGDMTMQVVARDATMALSSTSVQFGMGFITLLDYMIRPMSVVLMYFSFEGVVRFAAALISDEVVGTMPLHVVAWAQQRASQARAERAMGPRIADEIQPGDGEGYAFRILSCRPKPGWDHLITVSFHDELHEVVGQERGVSPRPYVYLLRPAPAHKIVRGLEQYDPEAVLRRQEL